MGLDWMLDAHKAKPGNEKEYRRIKDKLNALEADESIGLEESEVLRKDLEAALMQVAISPFEVIGAPRVGIDDEATEWFKREAFEPLQARVAEERKKPSRYPDTKPQWDDRNERLIAYWDRPFEQVLQDEKGKYVVELAKESEGIAAITGFLCSSLDFRGKAVSCSAVVSSELRSEAFDDHDASGCLDYADRLEASLEDFKLEHPDWGTVASTNDDAADIDSAVKWLRYWGTHGFGYSAWY